jgi:hypothetical protein
MSVAYSLLLGVLLVGCCGLPVEPPTPQTCDALYSEFFEKLNSAQREVEFSHLEIERKYDVYICGNQRVHPPTIYLAEVFARDGASVVQFLRKKLLATPNDNTIRDIVSVFGWMQRLGTYNVADDKLLFEQIKARASEINDDFWRKYVINDV